MADTPFGLTFGNPSKYIGSSGIGQAIKTGLTAYGMQKSGLTNWLNDLNKKPEGQTVVQGSVPLPASFNKYLSAVPPTSSSSASPEAANPNAGAFTQQAQNQVTLNQSMMPTPNAGGMTGAVAPEAGVVVSPVMDSTPPSDIGHQILDGNDDWQHSAVNPQAQRDSLVLPQQQTIEAPRLTGDEYKQALGYGNLKKAAMMMFGMG